MDKLKEIINIIMKYCIKELIYFLVLSVYSFKIILLNGILLSSEMNYFEMFMYKNNIILVYFVIALLLYFGGCLIIRDNYRFYQDYNDEEIGIVKMVFILIIIISFFWILYLINNPILRSIIVVCTTMFVLAESSNA